MVSNNEIAKNGWTAVPVDAGNIFATRPFKTEPVPILVKDIEFPSQDPLVAQIQKYAKERLPRQTYNHSMRVFYFSTVIAKQQFAEHANDLSPSTLALTCLLHDIGTAEENLSTTRMSFDLYGGIKAFNVLQDLGSTADQAGAVSEAIIRHQDLGMEGTITFLGQLIQLATIYDNVGGHPRVNDYARIIHRDTLEDVVRAFPREGWSGCFAKTLEKEVGLKPWCHSTHIPDFGKQILGNELMKPYD